MWRRTCRSTAILAQTPISSGSSGRWRRGPRSRVTGAKEAHTVTKRTGSGEHGLARIEPIPNLSDLLCSRWLIVRHPAAGFPARDTVVLAPKECDGGRAVLGAFRRSSFSWHLCSFNTMQFAARAKVSLGSIADDTGAEMIGVEFERASVSVGSMPESVGRAMICTNPQHPGAKPVGRGSVIFLSTVSCCG
jgi:hypothetical protein